MGGAFALVGGWLAVRWQAGHNAKALASSILAEITASFAIDPNRKSDEFYRQVLQHIRDVGEVPNREILMASLDQDPTVSLPVYYGNVSSIGLLPPLICKRIIVFYARTQSLRLSAIRFLCGSIDLSAEQLGALSYALEQQLDEVLSERDALVKELGTYLK